jgi:Tol biopolymer transport system component
MTNRIPLVLLFFFAIACKKEPSPVAPPSSVDTLLTSERQLAAGNEPAISPDGTKIAYTYQGNICEIDTSGANRKQLTSSGGDEMPRWSPDGQNIGFIRTMPGVYDQGLLYSVPASGGGATQLVFNEFVGDELIQEIRNYGSVGSPIWDWSPDGKFVALLQNAAFDTATFLKIVNLSSNQEIYSDITFYSLYRNNGSCFQWSFDENEIAYHSINKFNEYITLVNLASKVVLRDTMFSYTRFITKNTTMQQFAFISASDSSVGFNGFEIALSDLKSNAVTYYYPIYTDGKLNQGLKWSPDGKYFLYQWQQSVGGALGYDYSTLYLYSINRSKNYQLTSTGDIIQPNDLFFEWANSGNTIYFERFGYINAVTFKLP